MSFSNRGTNLPGILAAADLSAAQHRFVTIDTNGKAGLSTAGQRIDAALENNPGLDQPCSLMGSGSVAKITAGDTVTAGDSLASDATGRAVLAAAGNNIGGVALQSGVVGQLISVWFNPIAGAPAAASAAYTPTNVTPDRAYDADTVAVAELADVVGTLIADLQAAGILG